MLFSDVSSFVEFTVLRDGSFGNLGFLSDPQDSMLTFLENKRFAPALRRNKTVSAVLTAPELAESVPESVALAVCSQPRLAFAALHNHLARGAFYWHDFPTLIDPEAQVHPSAWVAEKNVRIGRGSVVGPQAAVLERCLIGEDVIVGAGVVLGGAGFQTVRSSRPMVEMLHAGGLIVRDGVHVLPGAVIATGLFRQCTEISAEARIGSQAFVSHAVQVGRNAFVGHGAMVNGNVIIGDEAWIGPGTVIANNLTIGSQANVSLGSVVIRDVPPGAHVSGNFATSHRNLLRQMASMDSQALTR